MAINSLFVTPLLDPAVSMSTSCWSRALVAGTTLLIATGTPLCVDPGNLLCLQWEPNYVRASSNTNCHAISAFHKQKVLSGHSAASSNIVYNTGNLLSRCVQATNNVTFTFQCTGYNGARLTWCAFGISTSGIMFPSEVWIAFIHDDGTVNIEARHTVAHAMPLCMATQVPQLLSYSVAPGLTSANVTWTRPLTLPPSVMSQGYNDITNASVHLVASTLWSASYPPSAPCSPFSVHYLTSNSHTANFFVASN